MADLIDIAAGVDDESQDEDIDSETGESRRKTNGVNGNDEDAGDSSEEESENEEAERAVREGFIVDEEDEEDRAERRRRRKERKKRRREEREEEGLDEEDLDLIGALPEKTSDGPTFKRLKRGHREERPKVRGVDDIFSDEEEERLGLATSRNAEPGEFDDFIEEDEPDEGEGEQEDHEVMVGRTKRGLDALRGLDVGLDEASIEDMRAAFGDGTEYDWALDMQDDMDIGDVDPDKPIELKDVFEPSQLHERMLTDEDNLIRHIDIPERMQLARKNFPKEDLDEQELAQRHTEEAEWISGMLWPKKRLESEFLTPFKAAIKDVLGFMNGENFEVPFIFQHRKDFLIHAGRTEDNEDNADQGEGPRAEKLLNQTDLWEIFDLDLKYRGLLQKRQAVQKLYDNVSAITERKDEVIDNALLSSSAMEDVQDIQDYINFQYAAELKDATLRERVNGQKRSRPVASLFERLRIGPGYNVVRGFGITPDTLASSMLDESQHGYTEDPERKPADLADDYIDNRSFPTGEQVLRAAKLMFAEELAMNPKMRKYVRRAYYMGGQFNCHRTERGLRQIDEDNPNYEFKYLREQGLAAMAQRPDLFLRMLKAEEDGLVEVRLTLQNSREFKKKLLEHLESDNFSETAEAWNLVRREALDLALSRLEKIIIKGVKESLKTECENAIARECRDECSNKLDQVPYKPGNMDRGVVPRAMTMSLSRSNLNIVHWVWIEEEGGRVNDRGILNMQELRLGNEEKGLADGNDVVRLRDILERKRPDIIGISGFTAETRTLYKNVQEIISKFDLRGDAHDDDPDDDDLEEPKRDLLDVIIMNDEVARLYSVSPRAETEFPGYDATDRYCVALARYLQSPIKQYIALGSDILSIMFHTHQNLVPREKLLKYLETAMVDMVNLAGVQINECSQNAQEANMLSYVCGLGPRKAQSMLEVIKRSGGQITTRTDLIGDPETGRQPAVTPKVLENCASFLYIKYDPSEPGQCYLDNTRAHPEDYDLANKMAADAMDMDEEDVKAEKDEYGEFAVLRKMYKEQKQGQVNELVLEMYAKQLETNLHQRKRATLETIRAELADPYEELRGDFAVPSADEVFTMLTGETRDSLCEGMVVPISVRKAFHDHLEVKLDCGIEGGVSESEYPAGVGQGSGMDPRTAFKPYQTMQAKILFLSRRQLTAQLSLRDDAIRRPYKKEWHRDPFEWDIAQEEADKRNAVKEKETVTGRPQRVIKHPLFRPFSSAQAEEYLGPQNRGDVVIRPSSKGMDHLAVTWKVSDNVFQHIDVLELDKENEFSVGKFLKIGGRYTYSDLDELIASYVKSMVKKVDEIMADERYQRGSKGDTERWLTAYMEANPKRSMYAFCINDRYPGYFHLCFKQSPQTKPVSWPIKVIPGAFELQKNPYPDMRALKNGFKTLVANEQAKHRRY